MSELLTATDVAAQLKVSRSKAYALKHEIGYVEVGGNVRFEQEAVDAYKQRCKRAPQKRGSMKWESRLDTEKKGKSGSLPKRLTVAELNERLKQSAKRGNTPPRQAQH